MNPNTKMFHNGKEINWKNQYKKISWFTRAQRFTLKWTKRIAFTAFVVGMLYGVFTAGSMSTTAQTVFAEREVIKEVEVINAPVLDRIAQCESGGQHRKNGQVIFKANTNGSVDIGKYQINSIWNQTATKMGLDLTKEEDNKKFAEYLYTNKGTQPWEASAKCWIK